MVKRKIIGNTALDKELAFKILRTVSTEKGFRFYKNLGSAELDMATSLEDFATKLKTVDLDSVDFHFQRSDFQKWIEEVVGDCKLSLMISNIGLRVHGKELRSRILKTVNNRVARAHTIAGTPIESNSP